MSQKILVSRSGTYYNFYLAVQDNKRVYLTELKKNVKTLVKTNKQVISKVTPTNETFNDRKLLYTRNGKYYIQQGIKEVEIIGAYSEKNTYINIFSV